MSNFNTDSGESKLIDLHPTAYQSRYGRIESVLLKSTAKRRKPPNTETILKTIRSIPKSINKVESKIPKPKVKIPPVDKTKVGSIF